MKSETPSTPEHYGFTVDDKLLLAVLQRCLEDPREAVGPVVTILGEQPNVAASPFYAQALAVVFDFVDPVGPGRYHLGGGKPAKFERSTHRPQIGLEGSRRKGRPCGAALSKVYRRRSKKIGSSKASPGNENN
ncbi:hypothetical protein [Bradyrhizobium sp. S3.2.12]|uniref:hypothetical protein n=1 Tax=Bradyrhizobium sp. S3.2.12 TaxID=3156387 RepID=UPI0033984101